MNAQSELNKILGSVTSGVGAAISVGKAVKEKETESGIDEKMAEKARKTAEQKISAMKTNKERTRRVRVAEEMIGGKE